MKHIYLFLAFGQIAYTAFLFETPIWIYFAVFPIVLSAVATILFMHMPGCSACGGCGCCNIHNDVHMYEADTGLVIRQDDQDANNDDDIEMAEQ